MCNVLAPSQLLLLSIFTPRNCADLELLGGRKLNTLRSEMSSRLFCWLVALSVVRAHPHHEHISEEDLNAPIDSILYLHIGLQALVWGFLLPTGMVLGMTKCFRLLPVVRMLNLYLGRAGTFLCRPLRWSSRPPVTSSDTSTAAASSQPRSTARLRRSS